LPLARLALVPLAMLLPVQVPAKVPVVLAQ
jgi:hypothetical protein